MGLYHTAAGRLRQLPAGARGALRAVLVWRPPCRLPRRCGRCPACRCSLWLCTHGEPVGRAGWRAVLCQPGFKPRQAHPVAEACQPAHQARPAGRLTLHTTITAGQCGVEWKEELAAGRPTWRTSGPPRCAVVMRLCSSITRDSCTGGRGMWEMVVGEGRRAGSGPAQAGGAAGSRCKLSDAACNPSLPTQVSLHVGGRPQCMASPNPAPPSKAAFHPNSPGGPGQSHAWTAGPSGAPAPPTSAAAAPR